MPGSPTNPQLAALKWLRARNGDGIFAKDGVLVAAGERAPIMRSTWNRVTAMGMTELYAGNRHLRVTDFGSRVNVSHVEESK